MSDEIIDFLGVSVVKGQDWMIRVNPNVSSMMPGNSDFITTLE